MKLTITLEADQFTDVPWPEGVPLPAAGDQVTVNQAGRQISFVVDGCAFDLTRSNGQGAHVTVRGHHAPAGSV